MWKLFFEICDILCWLIPSRSRRDTIRRVHLYDWRNKYNALRRAFPELNFRHTRIIKGGWNIGFIVDKKYVFKIRKRFDANTPAEKIMREKRITDAFRAISPFKIPHIEIVTTNGFTFFKYDFIPGHNLNTCSESCIKINAHKIGKQLAQFINAIHNARPSSIEDLRTTDGDGWNHNDICNNIIINKKTMNVVGLIDWEYSGWGKLDTEFKNITRFSKKIRNSGLGDIVIQEYKKLNTQNEK